MSRRLPAVLLLALSGCTVQLGRDPKNTFEVDTDLTPDTPPAPPAAERPADPEAPPTGAGPDAPPTAADPVRPDEVSQEGLQRNWRIGAENTAPDRKDPKSHYTDLYLLFRNDHIEAARLTEQGMRSRAQLFANRAARRLGEMKPLLAPEEREAFGEMIGRYGTYAEGIPDREGSLLRLNGQALASEIARRFAPESARLAPPEVPAAPSAPETGQ